jgi:hypothetical protein
MPLIVALFACGKGKAQCKADVDELVAYLRSIDHSGSMYWDSDVTLVPRPDLPKKLPSNNSPVVVIGKTIRINSTEVTADVLLVKLQMWQSRKRQDPTEVILVIDPNAQWGTVAQVTGVLADGGYTHPAIAFGQETTDKPPPPAPVDDKLAALMKSTADGGNKATELAKLFSKTIKGCKPMEKAFGAVGADDGADKAQILIDATGPAILECNCDLDVPSFRNVFYSVLHNPHPATVIHLDLAKGGKAIALPATAPWSEAQKQLADGASVWFFAT